MKKVTTPKNTIVTEKITVDAEGRPVGRVSSEVAKFLLGKHLPSFTPNKIAQVKVTIVNASKAKIDPKKLETVSYLRYSGYPGGLTKESMGRTIKRKGYATVFENAIYGMLPMNKLRKGRMKNLTIKD